MKGRAADATVVFSIIVSKDFFENNKPIVKRCKFFLVEGKLDGEENVVHIQAKRITQLSGSGLVLSSHDFH
ncbi:hypothetical protein [Edaphobacter modestus]|uniref:hypothetical protein n=1 Tax=Edaphobacter modestus TaxID=388466 RepID=UPI00102B3D05|nr:hypothetical protein [Edaphobacter modestus]